MGTHSTLTGHGNVSARAARLPSLRLGDTHIRDVTVSLIEAPAALREVRLGMTVLLRYESVCFAWKEMRLHLGNLGPCTDGLQPHHATVSPWCAPFIEVAPQEEDDPVASDTAYAHWKRASPRS